MSLKAGTSASPQALHQERNTNRAAHVLQHLVAVFGLGSLLLDGLIGSVANRDGAPVFGVNVLVQRIAAIAVSQRRCDVLTHEEGLEPVSQIATVVLSPSSTPRLNAQGIADSDARKHLQPVL